MNKRVIGMVLVLVGLLFSFNSALGITGFVVVENITASVSGIIGLVLVIGGVVVMVVWGRREKIKSQLENMLNSGQIGGYGALRRYAGKLDLTLKEGRKHTEVYKPNDEFLTKIPRHKGTAIKGTYRGILNKLYDYASTAA